MNKLIPILFVSILLISGRPARADVAPNGLFGDNAVLQQGRRVPVWGTAAEGEKVTVSFAGQKAETVTKGGRWMVWLEPMKANSTPQTMTISGSNTLTYSNLLIGEVWLCGGQSNMERTLAKRASQVNKQNPEISLEKEASAAPFRTDTESAK